MKYWKFAFDSWLTGFILSIVCLAAYSLIMSMPSPFPWKALAEYFLNLVAIPMAIGALALGS